MEEFARLLLLVIAAAIAINLVQHGRPGVGAWFRAKFLGQESAAAVRR